MKIEITIKSVYGAPTIYPANEAARALADIAGTKTLQPQVLRRAVAGLGAEVVLVSDGQAELLREMLAGVAA